MFDEVSTCHKFGAGFSGRNNNQRMKPIGDEKNDEFFNGSVLCGSNTLVQFFRKFHILISLPSVLYFAWKNKNEIQMLFMNDVHFSID